MATSDLPVFTICSKEQTMKMVKEKYRYENQIIRFTILSFTFWWSDQEQYREDKLQKYGIQSSNSYAMDTDWVGTGSEDPEMIFEDSVLKLDDMIIDIKVYLDKPTPEGQSIVRKSAKTV